MKIASMPISSYALVLPADALSGIRDAARVLVNFIGRATGATLPIRSTDEPAADCEIVLGTTDRDTPAVLSARAAIRDDGFALVADGTRLYITATTGRGVVYGVYAFIEDYLGVRFCTSRFHVLHKDAVRDVPAALTRVENPGFMSRDTFWYDVLEPVREGGMNFPCAVRSNHGTMPEVGGGVSYAGGLVHTFPALADTAHEPGVQPCLTDEAVFVKVRDNVRKWLDENPTAKIISVSQNDSYAEQLGCQCPACKALDDREGTSMGSLLTFVNRIADDIKDDYPDIWVDTLAYRYTRKAPKTIKPADNVIIRLCSIECCFAHPLSDPDCPQNQAFVRDIEEWSAICKNLYIWDYTTDFLFYLSPFPNFGVLRENVKFFKEHNAIGMFEQGNYQSYSGEFGELRAYLLAKLLWDPTMSEETYGDLMNGFLRDYYGPGWPSVRAYIDETTALAARRHLAIYDHPNEILLLTDENGNPDPALCDHLLALWDEALAAAETEEEALHVRTSRIQVLCLSTFLPETHPDFKARLQMLHDSLREAGIVHFREGTPIPADIDPENLPLLH